LPSQEREGGEAVYPRKEEKQRKKLLLSLYSRKKLGPNPSKGERSIGDILSYVGKGIQRTRVKIATWKKMH